MKKLHYLVFALIMGLSVSMTSCSSDDDTPEDPSAKLPVATKTIADLRALTTGDAVEVPADFIFKGIVVSSQGESNNFYQAIYLQDGDVAVKVSCLKEGDKLYETFKAGQEVFVKAAGLFIGKHYDTYTLGFATDDKYTVSRIPDLTIKDLFIGGSLDKAISPKEVADISLLTPEMVGTLVKVTGVQVITADKGKTLGKKDQGYTEIKFITADNKKISISNNNFADFSETVISEGSGSISGILNTFGSNFQIALTRVEDLDLKGERFADPVDETEEFVKNDVGDNLMANADLEAWDDDNNPTGFTHVENITKEATTFHGGSFSAKFMSSSKTKDFGTDVALTGGKKYRVSFWYLDNDVNARLRVWSKFRSGVENDYIDLTSDDDKAVLQSNTYSEDAEGWKQFNAIVTAPAEAAKLYFEVRAYKGDEAGGFIYIDDIEIFEQE